MTSLASSYFPTSSELWRDVVLRLSGTQTWIYPHLCSPTTKLRWRNGLCAPVTLDWHLDLCLDPSSTMQEAMVFHYWWQELESSSVELLSLWWWPSRVVNNLQWLSLGCIMRCLSHTMEIIPTMIFVCSCLVLLAVASLEVSCITLYKHVVFSVKWIHKNINSLIGYWTKITLLLS